MESAATISELQTVNERLGLLLAEQQRNHELQLANLRPFLTYDEAGELARCSKYTIRNLVNAGQLRRSGFSTARPLIRRDDLIEALSSGKLTNVRELARAAGACEEQPGNSPGA